MSAKTLLLNQVCISHTDTGHEIVIIFSNIITLNKCYQCNEYTTSDYMYTWLILSYVKHVTLNEMYLPNSFIANTKNTIVLTTNAIDCYKYY